MSRPALRAVADPPRSARELLPSVGSDLAGREAKPVPVHAASSTAPPLAAAAAAAAPQPIGLHAQMLPLVAHISRRGKGETNGKQEAPTPASPAKPAAAASPAAGAGRAGWDWLQQLSVAVSPTKPTKPDAMEAPPVKDASTGEAFPAAQRFW